ncbi:MAG TPA: hypothetical protein VIR27_11020 [Mycobacteriales bacterium]
MGQIPTPEEPTRVGLDRRTALKRGALVGGSLVWAVPVVQAVSLTAAHAESPSSPPHGGPPAGPPGNPPEMPPPNQPPNQPPVAPPAGGPPPVSPPASPPASPQARGELAFTGPGLPVVPTVAVAASLIATGAAAQAVGRHRDPDLDDAEDDLA